MSTDADLPNRPEDDLDLVLFERHALGECTLEETARQQTSAKEMAERVGQALGRYRNLAGRVSQAGKHMSEAKRGLDKQETGDGVQEQESQAIIRLSEALRMAQQQQQQQQQQARRQQQQQQRQQGQQQQAQQGAQPSSGTQQQGNRPALQSVQRRTSKEDGPLAEFGAGGIISHNEQGRFLAKQSPAPASCPSICGNGILDAGEQCDDGNADDQDGCTNACTGESCSAAVYDSTWEAIQDVIFTGYECTNGICHAPPFSQGGLDLTAANAFANDWSA